MLPWPARKPRQQHDCVMNQRHQLIHVITQPSTLACWPPSRPTTECRPQASSRLTELHVSYICSRLASKMGQVKGWIVSFHEPTCIWRACSYVMNSSPTHMSPCAFPPPFSRAVSGYLRRHDNRLDEPTPMLQPFIGDAKVSSQYTGWKRNATLFRVSCCTASIKTQKSIIYGPPVTCTCTG